MLWTVIWTLLASLLTLGAAVLATPAGRRKLKKLRTKARQHRRRRAKAAWSAYRVRYRKTRRGARRASRRAQPPRLTFGHVRTKDDPTLGTKALRAARDRYQLRAQQAKDRKAMEPRRTWTQRAQTLASSGPWGSVKAEAKHKVASARGIQCEGTRVDGYRCQNRVMIGSDGDPLLFCYIHRNNPVPDQSEPSRNGAKR